MNTHMQKSLRTWFVPATLIVMLVGIFVVRTAYAKLSANTINPVGVATNQGRKVTVTGPISATAGERIELRVTVTQRSTGAVAEGVTFFAGAGQTNHWELTAVAEGQVVFEAGPATVVALARSSVQGQATDAHQWLVNVTLLSE